MRASLRATYGLDLREVVETRSITVGDLTDLIVWLPAGCPLWQDVGGPASMTGEQRLLRWVEFRLLDLTWVQAGGKKAGKRPEVPSEPPYAHEKRGNLTKMSRKAAAFLKRQHRDGAIP